MIMEVDLMFEFCEKCGSIMLPSKDKDEIVLECTLCGKMKDITDRIHEEYIF
jgi:DNA-directed RNA polymerase subunit M/transcription elongation factor TFIIS